MKKIAFLLCLAAGSPAWSQGFHLGAKAGANLAKIAGTPYSDQFRLGYQLGGYVAVDFTRGLGVQGEVLFNQSNTRVADNFGSVFQNISSDKKKLNYLSIPVLLRINPGENFTIHLGPQYSILMNPDDNLLKNGQNAFKKGDLSGVAGVQFSLGFLQLYGRYTLGLSDIDNIQDKGRSQQIQFGVGIGIF